MPLLDPLHVVLRKQLLVARKPFVVDLRVSPTIENIASFAGSPSGVAGRFFGRGAVVDDVHLVHAPAGQRNLVQNAVVVNAIAVHPIRSARSVSSSSNVVDIEKFRVVPHHAVVVLGFVVVLHEMVPSVPFPDNFSAVGPNGFHLDDVVRPDVVQSARGITGYGGVSSCLQRFFFGFFFPSDHQEVAVRHRFNIVVRNVQSVVVSPRPFQRSVPRDSLHFAAGTSSREVAYGVLCVVRRSQKVAVREQVSGERRSMFTRGGPLMNEPSFPVDEVGGVGGDW